MSSDIARSTADTPLAIDAAGSPDVTGPPVRSRDHRNIIPRRIAPFAALCAIAIGILTLVPIPGNTLFWSSLQNSGHTALFAVLTLAGIALLARSGSRYGIGIYPGIAAALLLLGIVVEIAQAALGRSGSWGDVRLNAAGIAVGLLLHLARTAGGEHRIALRWISVSLALVMLLVSFRLPIQYGIVAHFLPEAPIIADFDTVSAISRVAAIDDADVRTVAAPAGWASNTTRVLRLDVRPGRYAGMRIVEPFSDWYGYETFRFEVFNPSTTSRPVTVRVHDRHHDNETRDRFNRGFELPPGSTSIEIPVENIRFLGDLYSDHRQMDLTAIVDVAIFSSGPEEPFTLYLDEFRLE